MQWNDYLDEVRACAEDFMDNEYQHAGDYYQLHDIMRDEDSITGNASGSFTMNRAQAEENIGDILYDEGVKDRFYQLGYTDFPEEAETVDVIVRIMALDELYPELEEYFMNR